MGCGPAGPQLKGSGRDGRGARFPQSRILSTAAGPGWPPVRPSGRVEHMFDDTRGVDPAVLFPALAAAIDAVPLRPDRDTLAGTAGAGLTEQARALLVLRRRLDARLLGLLAGIEDTAAHDRDGFPTTTS